MTTPSEKTPINNHNIDSEIKRIYVTAGSSQTNDKGEICDRVASIMIGGKMHWLADRFASLAELNTLLDFIYISVDANGSWGMIEEDGTINKDNQVIPLDMSHELIFGDESSFAGMTAYMQDGSQFWTLSKLFLKYQVYWLRPEF